MFGSGTVTATVRTSTSSPAVTVATSSCRPGFDSHGAGSAYPPSVVAVATLGPSGVSTSMVAPGTGSFVRKRSKNSDRVPSRGMATSSKASERASPRGAMVFEMGGGAAL